ncbi:MAG TPA: ABC transporter ATP-binding protein [Rectinemataceae bacterium]|nr:ABC transporter ATP-binding protein [Rectinemataceae bacterium]
MSGLDIRNLAFSRERRGPILEDISFGVGDGKKLAILGANGAGKTTLLSLLGGRLAAGSGRILLDGVSVREISPRALAKKIAFLPQIERLPFNYKVLEFVLMGRAPHIEALAQPDADDEAAALGALSELGLESLAGRRAGEISGGEYQLVRIARCLAQEAEILLLDEPTSLLDPANAQRVARELASLASKGKTIVFTTHDMALARSLADTILMLGQRRLLRMGLPSEVLKPEFLEEAFGVEFGMGQVPTAYPAASPR